MSQFLSMSQYLMTEFWYTYDSNITLTAHYSNIQFQSYKFQFKNDKWNLGFSIIKILIFPEVSLMMSSLLDRQNAWRSFKTPKTTVAPLPGAVLHYKK